MSKAERAKQVRREINARIPSVNEFSVLLQEVIDDRLYEEEGYTTFTAYVNDWPELLNCIRTFKGAVGPRRLAVAQMTEEGATQQKMAATFDVDQTQISKDMQAIGIKPASPRGRKRRQKLGGTTNSASKPTAPTAPTPVRKTSSVAPRTSKPMTVADHRRMDEKEEIAHMRTLINRVCYDTGQMTGLVAMLLPEQLAIFTRATPEGRVPIIEKLERAMADIRKVCDVLSQRPEDWDEILKGL